MSVQVHEGYLSMTMHIANIAGCVKKIFPLEKTIVKFLVDMLFGGQYF